MSKSKLITASLHNSIKWAKTCPVNWKDRAYEDLTNTLARKFPEPIGPAKRGIDFEKAIYTILESKQILEEVKSSKMFKSFLKYLEGGEFQRKEKVFITIDKVQYCLYAKLDVWFPDRIVDLKTKAKWDDFSKQNLMDSFQHKLYCYVTKINYFEYFIAVFDGKEGSDIQEMHILPYTVNDFIVLEEEVIIEVKKMIAFLKKDKELNKLYNEKFCLY